LHVCNVQSSFYWASLIEPRPTMNELCIVAIARGKAT
jgi:hypothetical protein